MKKTTFTGGHISRRWTVGKRLSADAQKKIYDSFVGLKWSELKTLIQSLHPLEELISTTNILASVSTIDHKSLVRLTQQIVEAYMSDELSFEDLKLIVRDNSNEMFSHAEESGVSPDTIFFKDYKQAEFSKDAVVLQID